MEELRRKLEGTAQDLCWLDQSDPWEYQVHHSSEDQWGRWGQERIKTEKLLYLKGAKFC